MKKCKCCGSTTTRLVGAIDFNRSCLDARVGRVLPVSPQMVSYYSCDHCSFVWTDEMDDWPASRFQQDIYNADYIKVDPPIPGREHVPVRERPAYGIGQSIASCFDGNQSSIRVLDFGSGGDPGPTGLALQDRGFQVFSYDPYRAGTGLPDGTFALIVAIEVFEHCHDLEALARFMRERLAEDGVLWIQTLLHPHPTPKDVLSSWYIAPRNGHISIFTFPSLSALFRRFGINIVATASGLFGLKKMPGFRNGLFV